jgi:hypothetical protein
MIFGRQCGCRALSAGATGFTDSTAAHPKESPQQSTNVSNIFDRIHTLEKRDFCSAYLMSSLSDKGSKGSKIILTLIDLKQKNRPKVVKL